MNSSQPGKSVSLPPVLECEQRRLQELHSLDILDTAFEERFDRYTSLLASLFEFPICLVSLVDDDRQWFKSACGLDIRETERDISFCAHALAHNEAFVIPDTHADPRFMHNPLVTGDPFIRFYAGAVIYGPEGLPLGTLCLLDRKPRAFGKRDCKHLRQFAELVERELTYNHELQKVREAAESAALIDPLTGLPHRYLLEDRVEQLVQLTRVQKNLRFTVLHINVVDFLRVNRSLGREAGDTLLCELAQRLRELCPSEGAVARLHADHFAMVAPRADDESESLDLLTSRLARALSQPFFVDKREQFLRLRIGASSYHDSRDTAEDMLENAATAARYTGELLGTGVSVHFHDHGVDESLKHRFELEALLRRALEHEQFHLVFQPVFDIASGKAVSLETLIRWHEPTHGNIAPDEFIPLAEATGLIVPIGQWVLSEALRQHREWEEQGLKPLPIHVNLSARELERPDFIDHVTGLLHKAGVPGEALRLEITETALLHNLETNIEKMLTLTQLGVEFYIDDFGKGYSSLQYVRQLPATALKIDRSFVSRVTEDPGDATIARVIIALGQTLGATVIAEGVETEEQLEFLRAAGCDQAQGYLYGKPMTAAAVSECSGVFG